MATNYDPYTDEGPQWAMPDDGRNYYWEGGQWNLDTSIPYGWGQDGRYYRLNPDGSRATPEDTGVIPDTSPFYPQPTDTPATPETPSTPTGGGGGGGGTGNLGGTSSWSYPDYKAPEWKDPTPFKFDTANLYSDPSYQFRLNQGLGALQNAAIAKGIGRTGGTMKALIDYGQNAASQEYSNAYNRGLGEWNLNYGVMKDRYGASETTAKREYDAALEKAKAQDYWDQLRYKAGIGLL